MEIILLLFLLPILILRFVALAALRIMAFFLLGYYVAAITHLDQELVYASLLPMMVIWMVHSYFKH